MLDEKEQVSMEILEWINENIVWGIPVLILFAGSGIIFTIRTRCLQVLHFPTIIKRTLLTKQPEADGKKVSPFRTLTAALGATVGTGNIIAIGSAIAFGGAGAIFWMWISAILGMCTKFTEVTLAVHFRERNRHGDYVGGPMYYIKNGLGKNWRFLAVLYSAFGVLTVFGTGNATQVNTITTAIDTALINFNVISESSTGRLNLILGIVITLLVGMVLLGLSLIHI